MTTAANSGEPRPGSKVTIKASAKRYEGGPGTVVTVKKAGSHRYLINRDECVRGGGADRFWAQRNEFIFSEGA